MRPQTSKTIEEVNPVQSRLASHPNRTSVLPDMYLNPVIVLRLDVKRQDQC